MKKIIAVLLALSLCVVLCSCASMDRFRKNLEDDYGIMKLDDDDLEDYADLMDIDVDDYNIKSAIEAKHREEYTSVVIIECGSSSKASQLARDGSNIVVVLEKYYTGYNFNVLTKGRYVLFGEVNAIHDALGQ